MPCRAVSCRVVPCRALRFVRAVRVLIVAPSVRVVSCRVVCRVSCVVCRVSCRIHSPRFSGSRVPVPPPARRRVRHAETEQGWWEAKVVVPSVALVPAVVVCSVLHTLSTFLCFLLSLSSAIFSRFPPFVQ